MHGNVIGSSDSKSCVEESEIGAKTGVGAEEEEEDTTGDGKTADDAGGGKTADETAAEEIRKATERRCLRRERRRADLDIGDKENGKRHSSDDNTPKRLDTGRGGRETEDEKPEEEAGDEEVETWFEVGEARFEVVAPGCILAP